ncbi:hypothetical protein Zmor_020846 [Zophobas morio]|uniref:Uncharacterized protein n=1 Tax=Zophobas morio TaxID=2755281 RepID=A0AA38I5D5_9CUCU|nr:hypothetical protein Zmor_020846 [Zophobas morio]
MNPYATPVRRLWTVDSFLRCTAITGDSALVTRPSVVRKTWKRKSRWFEKDLYRRSMGLNRDHFGNDDYSVNKSSERRESPDKL